MARYNVVIETRKEPYGNGFGALVAEGPEWAAEVGCTSGHNSSRAAFVASREYILGSRSRPLHARFDFLHVEA